MYRRLATQPLAGPIIELPLGESFWEALKYMYFSTYHWLPIVNGASRFYPPTYTQLRTEIADLPSREAADLLSAIGVKTVIVHTDQLAPSETSRWQHANLAEIGLEEIARFGSDVVYRLLPGEVTPPLRFGLVLPDQPPLGEMMQLPAGATMRLGLQVESGSHRRWVDPSMLRRKQALIRWEEVESGKSLLQWETLGSPILLISYYLSMAYGWSES